MHHSTASRHAHLLSMRIPALFLCTLLCIGTLSAAGFTWNPSVGPASEPRFMGFASGAAGKLYAAASENGLLNSTDDGATWNRVSTSPELNVCMSVFSTPNGDLYANSLSTLFRSTDNGMSWNSISRSMEYIAANPQGRLFGLLNDSVFSSDNFGAQWNFVSIPPLSLYKVHLYRMMIGNNGEIFLDAQFWNPVISTDGGTSWFVPKTGNKGFDTGVWSLAYNPVSGTLYAASDKLICASTDGGRHWTKFARVTQGGSMRGVKPTIAVDGSDRVILGGTTQGSVQYTAQSAVVLPLPKYPVGSFITTVNGTLLAGYDLGGIYSVSGKSSKRTTINIGVGAGLSLATRDDGLTFATSQHSIYKYNPSTGQWQDMFDGLSDGNEDHQQIAFANSGKIFCAGGEKGGFVSTDNGTTWRPVVIGKRKNPARSIIQGADGNLYAGTGDGVYISRTDGKRWSRIVTFASAKALAVDQLGRVFMGSENGLAILNGSKFTTVSTPKIQRCLALTIATDGTVIAGTDAGMFRSTDAGLDWTAVAGEAGTGECSTLATGTGNIVVAGMRLTGGPIYISTDAGATWNNESAGFSDDYAAAVAIHPGGYLLALGSGTGVQQTAQTLAQVIGSKAGNRNPAASTMPAGFVLQQNYPNPFNPSTTIRYALPVESFVKVTLYNVVGQMVEVLVDGVQPAGEQSLTWNAGRLASGEYYYRLEATGTTNPGERFEQTRRMLLLK